MILKVKLSSELFGFSCTYKNVVFRFSAPIVTYVNTVLS
jgi:hypothetical protein